MDSHFKTRALEAGLLATSICPSPGFTPPTYEELEKQLEQLKPKQHPNVVTKNPPTQTLQKSAIDHHKQGNLMDLQAPQYTILPCFRLISCLLNVY